MVRLSLASKKDASRYHILPEPAHMIMAQACLGILIRLDDHVDEESIDTFPFARYAADHIGDHFELGGVLLRIQDEIDHFLDLDKPNFAAWLRLRGKLSWGQSPEALPLYYFAEFGLRGLVGHLILKHPQDSSTRGPYGMPLHIALRTGHTDISRLLLDCCDDVDVRDPEDQTALHLAMEGGFLDVIRTLLKRNANINARDNRGRTPLFRAITWIDVPVGLEPFPEHDAGVGTKVRVAIVAKQLLDYAADVHVWDDEGQTPLHRASDGNHFDVIQLLLQHGAGVDVQDNSHSTPLHLASDLGGLEAVRLLLENRANPHVRNNKSQTPLHLASGWNHIERMGLLLEYGADIDAQANDHSTPLHLASYNRNFEAVQLLLERGGVDVQNNEGRTPLHLAQNSETSRWWGYY